MICCWLNEEVARESEWVADKVMLNVRTQQKE